MVGESSFWCDLRFTLDTSLYPMYEHIRDKLLKGFHIDYIDIMRFLIDFFETLARMVQLTDPREFSRGQSEAILDHRLFVIEPVMFWRVRDENSLDYKSALYILGYNQMANQLGLPQYGVQSGMYMMNGSDLPNHISV